MSDKGQQLEQVTRVINTSLSPEPRKMGAKATNLEIMRISRSVKSGRLETAGRRVEVVEVVVVADG